MGAVDELINVIDKCEKLKTLRMANLGFDEKASTHFIDGLREHMTRKWGLLCDLQYLEWDEDIFHTSKKING